MERMERFVVRGFGDLAALRTRVRSLLADCDTDDVIDAMLVADELCGLPCQYGSVPATVSLIRSFDRPGLRVAIDAPPLRSPVAPSWSHAGGRVLEACATDWGIGNEGNRMKLWACVRLRSRLDLPAPRGSG
ncbi:hypothetical protein HFP15_13605 [Amycolatopsis sp. K13G38]|uniref:ATP-binding protein n=1 Tax=Amycolatopsis acididurans TaxID=2724524 RepID=A0ABX1J6K1_9PSEU|nr:hypothetical protein [Amycolatopsis acididurans]NKQ53917.1 hypothetical protein [Amycolatopsis acididurans]